MIILKLILKTIGFICLGIAFLSLYVPIFILSVIIQEMKEITTHRKHHEPPFSVNPLSDYIDQRQQKEAESRQWIVKPLKQFFMRSFNQLKNW
jgi:hypothetical protein